jgi:hypothetical protein
MMKNILVGIQCVCMVCAFLGSSNGAPLQTFVVSIPVIKALEQMAWEVLNTILIIHRKSEV